MIALKIFALLRPFADLHCLEQMSLKNPMKKGKTGTVQKNGENEQADSWLFVSEVGVKLNKEV